MTGFVWREGNRHDMKKIVIIGANEFQNPLILKAKEMGFETHVFAWQDGSVGERTADVFYPISIVEEDKILEKCREIHPDAIVTIATDLGGAVVNNLNARMGLPGNDPECSLIATNKYEMRQALQKAGIPVPGFVQVDTESNSKCLDGLKFPMIVKPTDRSGSRGVTQVDCIEEWMTAVKLACQQSFEHKAITEEYLTGQEYSCECISYQGKHTYLTLTQKYTTGFPHYIETAHVQPAQLPEGAEEKVKNIVFSALDALKIKNGASHTELKIAPDGSIGIIEVGARMGGDCIGSHLVPLSTGYDFVRMVIDVACGKKPDLCRGPHYGASAIRFVYGPEDLQCLEHIRTTHPEQLKYVSDIALGTPDQVTDSSSRFGFFIVACDTAEEAKRVLQL